MGLWVTNDSRNAGNAQTYTLLTNFHDYHLLHTSSSQEMSTSDEWKDREGEVCVCVSVRCMCVYVRVYVCVCVCVHVCKSNTVHNSLKSCKKMNSAPFHS